MTADGLISNQLPEKLQYTFVHGRVQCPACFELVLSGPREGNGLGSES